jgi:hypothetical protein
MVLRYGYDRVSCQSPLARTVVGDSLGALMRAFDAFVADLDRLALDPRPVRMAIDSEYPQRRDVAARSGSR